RPPRVRGQRPGPRPRGGQGGDPGGAGCRRGPPDGTPAALGGRAGAGRRAASGTARARVEELGRRGRGEGRDSNRRVRRAAMGRLGSGGTLRAGDPGGRRRLRPEERAAYCFLSSSESMMSANEFTSRAPTIGMPLMKNVGVPVTPYFCPSSKSFCTSALYLPLSRQLLNLSLSIPLMPPAVSTRSFCASFAWLANIASCISQNFPCSLAHSEAWAAMLAFGWNCSG